MGSLIDGILNGGFFTGTASKGFVGNLEPLEALPALDSSHQPFKRTDEFVGGPKKKPRKEAGKWSCEWQKPGTGKPDGKGKLSAAQVKAKGISSEQLCRPIGDEVAKHKDPNYTKLVRTKRTAKKAYNKAYKKFVKKEEKKGKHSRGYPQAPQPKYENRGSKWPKFDNPQLNKAFAKRLAKAQKDAASAAASRPTAVAASAPAPTPPPEPQMTLLPPVIETAAAPAQAAPAPRKRGGGQQKPAAQQAPKKQAAKKK